MLPVAGALAGRPDPGDFAAHRADERPARLPGFLRGAGRPTRLEPGARGDLAGLR